MKLARTAFVIIVVILGFTFAALKVAQSYFQEKLELTVSNQTSAPIGMYLRVIDLDINKTFEIPIEGLELIQPGSVKTATVYLDGLTPETCSEIVAKSETQTKAYPCGERVKIGNASFLTKTDLSVSF